MYIELTLYCYWDVGHVAHEFLASKDYLIIMTNAVAQRHSACLIYMSEASYKLIMAYGIGAEHEKLLAPYSWHSWTRVLLPILRGRCVSDLDIYCLACGLSYTLSEDQIQSFTMTLMGMNFVFRWCKCWACVPLPPERPKTSFWIASAASQGSILMKTETMSCSL